MAEPTSDFTIQVQNQQFAIQVLNALTKTALEDPNLGATAEQLDSIVWVKDIIANPPATEVTAADYLTQNLDVSDINNVFWTGGVQYTNDSYTIGRSYQQTYVAPTLDNEYAAKKYVDDNSGGGSALAGYTYRSDTGYLIGAGSVLNFTTAGAVGTTSDAATLRLDATAIRALKAGTVKVTWSGKNSDSRRAQIRVGGSNLQETGTGQPANSFSTIQEVRNVSANADIQIRNPGTGAASWFRWSMTVEFVAS